MRKILFLSALAGVLVAGLPASLFAASIDARSNIFVAGQDSTGINTMGGLFPIAIAITPGTNVISFSVTGTTTCAITAPCNSPLGGDGGNPLPGAGTNITANGFNGISGIIFTGREMFLAGVFLNNSIPTGNGPFTPTFVSTGGTFNADTDTSFQAFFLGQVFYIGDGRTGFNNAAGTTQLFNVPVGATRLFLGFADANNFTGAFGAYGDNGGALNVTINGIQPGAVPEPGTMMLLGLGLAGLALVRMKTK